MCQRMFDRIWSSLRRLPVAKNHNFGKFWFLGASVPAPFYWWWLSLVCYSIPTVHVYVSKFVSIGLFCRPLVAKNPNFAVFVLRNLAMWTTGSNLRKFSTGAQLQTFPYPTASKSFLYSNAGLRGEIGSTNSNKHKQTNSKAFIDGQTHKKLNVFRRSCGGWNPSHTKLGMVIEDLEHVLGPLKRLGVWRTVSPIGGTEKLRVTRPR